MKINFDAQVLDQKGKPIPVDDTQLDKPESDRECATLRTVSQQALLGTYPDEQSLDPAEKVKRWKLFNKIDPPGEIELKAEEVVTIKKLIGKGYPVLIVGRAYELLDPSFEEEQVT